MSHFPAASLPVLLSHWRFFPKQAALAETLNVLGHASLPGCVFQKCGTQTQKVADAQ